MIESSGLIFKGFLSYPDFVFEDSVMSFIVGESGVGKSALLQMINARESVDTGTLSIDGVDINKLDPITLRQDYLLCGQSVFLFPGSISDNFRMFYALRKKPMPKIERIAALLELVCLPVSLDTKVDSMSGGERQRIYLAIFISLARKFILLDEPTSALDKKTAERFLRNLKRYCTEHNLSAIIISHDPQLVDTFADAVVDLNQVKRGEF